MGDWPSPAALGLVWDGNGFRLWWEERFVVLSLDLLIERRCFRHGGNRQFGGENFAANFILRQCFRPPSALGQQLHLQTVRRF